MTFSMNADPASWVELVDGQLAFDQYPDGSFQWRVVSIKDDASPYTVVLKSTLPAAIIAAAQVVDALFELSKTQPYVITTRLLIQTLPDQRGDKQGRPGACISSRATASMIAAVDPDEIVVHDVHSAEALRFLRNAYTGIVRHVSSLACFQQLELPITAKNMYVVAVDEGARVRAREFADEYGASIIHAQKTRHADGQITGHEIIGNPPKMTKNAVSEVWVIDDLCDGGATFVSISKALHALYAQHAQFRLKLYVTHGLFSKGRVELLQHYDEVHSLFSYDGWRNPLTIEERATEFLKDRGVHLGPQVTDRID